MLHLTYNKTLFAKEEIHSIQAMEPVASDIFTWLKLSQQYDADTLKEISAGFQIPLALLEHITQPVQKTRFETYDHFFVIVLNKPNYLQADTPAKNEHISFIVGYNFLISFEPARSFIFNQIVHDLEETSLRTQNLNYLLCALIEAVLHENAKTVNKVEQDVSILEAKLLHEGEAKAKELHTLQQQFPFLQSQLQNVPQVIERVLHHVTDKGNTYLEELIDQASYTLEQLFALRLSLSNISSLFLTQHLQQLRYAHRILVLATTLVVILVFILFFFTTYLLVNTATTSSFLLWGIPILAVGAYIAILFYFRTQKWI